MCALNTVEGYSTEEEKSQQKVVVISKYRSENEGEGDWPIGQQACVLTLNRYCYVLRMERKAVGPVCCLIQEPSALIKKRGARPGVLGLIGCILCHSSL